MTKTFLVFLFVSIIASCVYGQTSTDTLFTITYQPALYNSSQLSVYKDKGSNKGLFTTYYVVDNEVKIDTVMATLSNETYAAYANFFSSYKFPGYIDNKLPDTTKNYIQGRDGITIIGAYYGDTKKFFRFWSPYHDKESMTLLKMTLNDLDKYFKNRSNKKYLKFWRSYSK